MTPRRQQQHGQAAATLTTPRMCPPAAMPPWFSAPMHPVLPPPLMFRCPPSASSLPSSRDSPRWAAGVREEELPQTQTRI